MRTVLTFCIALVAFSATAQREKFVRYNRTLERARMAEFQGEHAQALQHYDSAFALIPFIGRDYFDASLAALAAERDDKANELLIKGVENGLDLGRMYDPTLQAFLLSERAMPFLNTRAYMEERYRSHADTAYIRALKEIGSGNHMVDDPVRGLISVTDDQAFEKLMALVDEHGFPNLLNVGSAVFLPQWLFMEQLTGYPDDPRWRRVLPHIQRAINKGVLPPDYLCMFQDLEDRAKGRPETYGVLIRSGSDDAPVRLAPRAAVDRARASVGLGPIADAILLEGLHPSQVVFADEEP